MQIEIKPLYFFIFCTALYKGEESNSLEGLKKKMLGTIQSPRKLRNENSGPSRMRVQKAYLLLNMTEMDYNCKKPNLLNTELV